MAKPDAGDARQAAPRGAGGPQGTRRTQDRTRRGPRLGGDPARVAHARRGGAQMVTLVVALSVGIPTISSAVMRFKAVCLLPTADRAWYAKESQSELWDLARSEEHTSELQSLRHLVCRLL